MFRYLQVAFAAVLAMAAAPAQTPANQGDMRKMAARRDAQHAAPNQDHRYLLAVYALPEMQEELGLSAQQVTQLRQYRQDFVAKDSGEAKAGQQELAAAVTVGMMKVVLTASQWDMFAPVQPAELHNIAMERLSAEDSHQLMAGLTPHEEAAKGCGMTKKSDSEATGEHSHH